MSGAAATAELTARAARVRLVLLDVDGVLTDGRLFLASDGSEGRAFYVRDGLGIRLAQRAGLRFGILSGRDSPVVTRRAAELGIEEVHQGVGDKLERFERILDRTDLDADAICFMGDDLIDVPVLRRAGLAAVPADGMPEARAVAHYVTERKGGRGAVREVLDLLLRAGGRWETATAPWLRG